jgi:hypothetical protein
MMGSVNNKYKTVMCKHFEQHGYCHLGGKCHFAHGKEDLRSINDPIPEHPNTQKPRIPSKPYTPTTYTSSFSSLPPTISNYKTVKCKFFEKGFCKFNQNCGFAHGDHELRTANSPLPQNVVNAGMQTNNLVGPSMYDSTVQNQIPQQQIFYLISQMEGYHTNNQDILNKIKQAQELNVLGNVQAAASVVYTIINRPDKSQEDSENYAKFVQNIQNFGPLLYQQIQLQYTQQASSLGLFGFNSQPMGSNQMMSVTPNLSTNMDMNMPFNITTGTSTMLQQGTFGNTSYKGNNQPPHIHNGQENGASQNMTGSIDHLRDTNPMSMLGLANMMGSMQLGGNMTGYNPNPLGGTSNQNENKNFGN